MPHSSNGNGNSLAPGSYLAASVAAATAAEMEALKAGVDLGTVGIEHFGGGEEGGSGGVGGGGGVGASGEYLWESMVQHNFSMNLKVGSGDIEDDWVRLFVWGVRRVAESGTSWLRHERIRLKLHYASQPFGNQLI